MLKKIIITIIIIIVIGGAGYFIYQLIFSAPQGVTESEAKNCESDSDCFVFGQDGDCNCGCFNKNYQWQKQGDCFCAAPRFCKCVNGECEPFFEQSDEEACLNSGGAVSTSLCCKTTDDYPNLCHIGACGCSPDNSHQVKICECGEGKCFNGEKCIKIAPLGRDPLNSTYIINNDLITLKDGYSEQEIMPGSATKIKTRNFNEPVIGDINKDGNDDAVMILTYDPGGSGTFYYVAAAVKEGDNYRGTNAVFIGDRIAPQITEIRDGEIIVNYSDRYPWESFARVQSSVNVGKSKYLFFEGGELKEKPREELSLDTAHNLVIENWGDCDIDRCEDLNTRTLDGKDGIWYIEAIYDGMRDDSVRAEKRIASVHYVNGQWEIGKELVREYKCQPGRGHQDFSSELCL